MTVASGKEGSNTSSPNTNSIEKNLLWGAGHAVFLSCSLLYFVSSATFFYKLALLGLLSSLMVEIYRTCLTTAPLAEVLFSSTSTPYFYLALLLYILPAASVPLAPLAIMSLLSLNSFARANLTQTPWWSQLAAPSSQLLALRPTLMDLASHLELAALPCLLVSIFSTGIALPIVYGSFLRWQYFVSPRTRTVVGVWDEMGTKVTENPNCPKQVRKAYTSMQGAIKKWAKMTASTIPRSKSK